MKLFASLLMFVSTAAFGSVVEVPKNTIAIIGGIGGKPALDVAQAIEKQANGKGADIGLFINSPGGDIVTGNFIVSSMQVAQSRGHRVKCYVGALAASMAFMILSQCDERYILQKARLLWHGGRTGGMFVTITEESATDVAQALRRENQEVREALYKKIPASREFIDRHFLAETLWDAHALDKEVPGFIEVVEDIRGLPEGVSLFDVVGQRAEGFSNPLLERGPQPQKQPEPAKGK